MSNQEFQERKQEMIEVNKKLVKKDQLRIKAYIERHDLDMQESKTGLWYRISKAGTGDLAKEGDRVKLTYRVELLDGTVCYSSKDKGAKEFTVGRGGVESGLEEAVHLLREGDEATIILPPHLAHGLPGDGDKIPPRSTIVYSLKLISLE